MDKKAVATMMRGVHHLLAITEPAGTVAIDEHGFRIWWGPFRLEVEHRDGWWRWCSWDSQQGTVGSMNHDPTPEEWAIMALPAILAAMRQGHVFECRIPWGQNDGRTTDA